MNIKDVSYRMEVKSESGNCWFEDLNGFMGGAKPTEDWEAVKQAKEVVGYFNRTLRPFEEPRELVGVVRVTTEFEGIEIVTN